ncbi:GNAT family N-acetyltransferase [Streptomyces sp. XM4193]|uniref:GNAT family N-acetyltransferase n=1 Tax=Streptomyces sp. XM4193 TaxID=2929782 RepID=UPI001FF80047|nr:GNAT family N-acetyltransferase [Streptomyces sp. XM4193]MCK1796214.1 GNAT family N-acetyltransferase [Streptomyces sp. XM4193]
MDVRPFRESDLPGAAKALIEVHGTDGYPVEGVSAPESWLRSVRVRQAWVADSGGEITGHVALVRPRGEAAAVLWAERSGESQAQLLVLARLFVLRKARRRAVGERLVRAAMGYGHEQGQRLVLDVLAKDQAAKRLYERLGWRPIGTAEHRYGDGRSMQATCYVSPVEDR